MITDAILSVLFFLPDLLIQSLPEIELTLPDNVYNGIDTFFCNVGYVIPFRALMPLLSFSIGISVFRIFWALLLRIKSFIPSMGA